MMSEGTDPAIVRAWLAARSIARGLPAPVDDRGGFRVDTGSDTEVRRWVFPAMGPGLRELAGSITAPGHLLKLCGDADELRSVLSPGWQVHAPGYVMRSDGAPTVRPPPAGYRIELARSDAVVRVHILSGDGAVAASGYAVEAGGVFVYDRIVTQSAHRRRGLGGVVMAILGSAKRDPASVELLVATDDGRALYSTLGWRTVSAYSTASLTGD